MGEEALTIRREREGGIRAGIIAATTVTLVTCGASGVEIPESRPRIFLRPELVGPLRERCLRDKDIQKVYERVRRGVYLGNVAKISSSSKYLSFRLGGGYFPRPA